MNKYIIPPAASKIKYVIPPAKGKQEKDNKVTIDYSKVKKKSDIIDQVVSQQTGKAVENNTPRGLTGTEQADKATYTPISAAPVKQDIPKRQYAVDLQGYDNKRDFVDAKLGVNTKTDVISRAKAETEADKIKKESPVTSNLGTKYLGGTDFAKRDAAREEQLAADQRIKDAESQQSSTGEALNKFGTDISDTVLGTTPDFSKTPYERAAQNEKTVSPRNSIPSF